MGCKLALGEFEVPLFYKVLEQTKLFEVIKVAISILIPTGESAVKGKGEGAVRCDFRDGEASLALL